MLRIAQALLAAVLTAAAATALAVPPPPTITLPASIGDVEFPHRAHFVLPRMCWACHAEGRIGKIIADPEDRAPTVRASSADASLRDRGHSLCLECHRAVKKENATIRCYGCHQRPSAAPGANAAQPEATVSADPQGAPPAPAPAEP